MNPPDSEVTHIGDQNIPVGSAAATWSIPANFAVDANPPSPANPKLSLPATK
jgi:hypothetical protein